MYRHYFITAIRNLNKNLVYSLLNIFGLALGIAVTLLVFLFIQFENSYDKYHKDYKQIYRVYRTAMHPEFGTWNDAKIGGAFYEIARQNFPGVESITRVIYTGDLYFLQHNEYFKESKLIYVDPSFFSVFTFPLIKGDPKTALSEPKSIVITEEIAKKYFGNDDPIGKTIDDKLQLKVTGILKDIPDRSHFRFNMVRSIGAERGLSAGENSYSWTYRWNTEVYTYIKLQKGFDPDAFRSSIGSEFVKKYVDVGNYRDYKLNIEPLEKIHLHSRCESYIGGDIGLTSDNQSGLLYIFGFLGLSVLIIACVNFTNIIISRSLTRAKEVAIRKVTGAKRYQLIQQFIGEYIIIAFLALDVALLTIELFLPSFSAVIGRKITVDYFHNYLYLFVIFIILIATGIVSGIYPSIVLSAFSPVKVLSNSLKINRGGFLRKILIVLQFTFSILLILIAIFCYKQANKWTGSEIGFHKENILVMEFHNNAQREKYDILKNELLKLPYITGITASSTNLSMSEPAKYIMNVDDKKEQPIDLISVDCDYIKTLGIELRQGRDYFTDNTSDEKNSFIIDEATVKLWNLKDPLGKQVELLHRNNGALEPYLDGKIIGVIRNFNYLPGWKNREQKGLILNIDKQAINAMFIRVRESNEKMVEKYMKEVYENFFPQQPIIISSLTENIENNFVIKIFKKIIFFLTIIPVLASIIALMGIFALVLQSVQRRTKEIAIRKIFGTPVFKLVLLQTREYSILILFANLIALSIGYLLLNVLLRQSAGFEAPGAGIYLLVCSLTYISGMLTVIFVVIKSVRKNPVNVLKYQ